MKTIRLTKNELKSVDHIDNYLKEIEDILKKGDDLIQPTQKTRG